MLINADFERHGFKISAEVIPDVKVYYTAQGFVKLHLYKARNSAQKVCLYCDGEHIGTEMMWTPNQLKEFLLFHKVIADNKKLL